MVSVRSRGLSPFGIALIVFVCVFAGAAIGIALNARLPDSHLEGPSAEVVKLVIGLIGTMAAVVLGLLIASAKSTYDTQASDVAQLSAGILQLDRLLANYGPEAKDARDSLRQDVIDNVEEIWPKDSVTSPSLAPLERAKAEAFYVSIQRLSPQSDAQRFAKSQALQVATDVYHTRLLMFAQQGSAISISLPFLIVLVSWLILLFVGFGLLTPFNGTVVTALLVGALSVAGALFLILEMNHPYSGLMGISSAPLLDALAQMDH
jgi:hypothetical protein